MSTPAAPAAHEVYRERGGAKTAARTQEPVFAAAGSSSGFVFFKPLRLSLRWAWRDHLSATMLWKFLARKSATATNGPVFPSTGSALEFENIERSRKNLQ